MCRKKTLEQKFNPLDLVKKMQTSDARHDDKSNFLSRAGKVEENRYIHVHTSYQTHGGNATRASKCYDALTPAQHSPV